jgi:hypothetical protein
MAVASSRRGCLLGEPGIAKLILYIPGVVNDGARDLKGKVPTLPDGH